MVEPSEDGKNGIGVVPFSDADEPESLLKPANSEEEQ